MSLQSTCMKRKGILCMDIGKRVRYHFLDGIRGIVLFSMIAYHFSWNMVYLYGVKWPWYHSTGAYIWQQSICWTFIILSGFCWSMGKHPLRRGLMVFGGGILVSAVTIAVMPQNRILFGVLTCIGSCMLLLIPLDKYLKKVPTEAGMLGSLAMFVLTRNVNAGFLGFEAWKLTELPRSLYKNMFTTYLGMPYAGFYSTDYFSLIPWFFLFVTGYFLYGVCKKHDLFQQVFWQRKIPAADFLGKHSLLVYLLHQPVIYLFQEILNGAGII